MELLPFDAKVQPVLLIGLDHIHIGATSTLVQNGLTNPIAAQTKLGWVAYGPAKMNWIIVEIQSSAK